MCDTIILIALSVEHDAEIPLAKVAKNIIMQASFLVRRLFSINHQYGRKWQKPNIASIQTRLKSLLDNISKFWTPSRKKNTEEVFWSLWQLFKNVGSLFCHYIIVVAAQYKHLSNKGLSHSYAATPQRTAYNTQASVYKHI